MRNNDLPPFDALGRDLLVIHPWRRAVSLAMPFVLAIALFVLAAYGRWAEAIASTMRIISNITSIRTCRVTTGRSSGGASIRILPGLGCGR